VNIGKKIADAVAASVKGELRLNRASREAILDYLLKWLEKQSTKNQGQDGWDDVSVKTVSLALKQLSEDVFFTVDNGEIKVGTNPRSYNVLASLQRGTRLLDPIDKLTEVLLSVVSDKA
jgi:hypothetical protein